VEHQAQEGRVALNELDQPPDDDADDEPVVEELGGSAELVAPLDGALLGRFPLENGGVEVVLPWEVAKNDGFGYSGRLRDFARRRAGEALFCKQTGGNLYELQAALVRGKPLGCQEFGCWALVSKYSLGKCVLTISRPRPGEQGVDGEGGEDSPRGCERRGPALSGRPSSAS
jgi:hypothetical protein